MTFQTKIREQKQQLKNMSFKEEDYFFSSWFYWKTINIGWTPSDVLCPEPLNTKCYSSYASKRIFCHKLSFSKASSPSHCCQESCQKNTSMEAVLHYFVMNTPQASVQKYTIASNATGHGKDKKSNNQIKSSHLVLPVVRDVFNP